MSATVELENLEFQMEVGLEDQALINRVRNAADALRDTLSGIISLATGCESDEWWRYNPAGNG